MLEIAAKQSIGQSFRDVLEHILISFIADHGISWKWEISTYRILDKAQTSVYVSFKSAQKFNTLLEAIDHVELFKQYLLRELERRYVFEGMPTMKTSLNSQVLTLRMWFTRLHYKIDDRIFGGSIGGYYINLVKHATELQRKMRKENIVGWFYKDDGKRYFSPSEFTLHRLFKIENDSIKESRDYLCVPTYKQLCSILIPAFYEHAHALEMAFTEWRTNNDIKISTKGYDSSSCVFFRFFMFAAYDQVWKPEIDMWSFSKPDVFKINEYLSLKLEYGQTSIYVRDKLVSNCKYLLFNLPIQDLKKYDQINSIDEAEALYDHSHEVHKQKIPKRVEFWGHCSNLQVWSENNYDSRLLHRNLAFPLLKELARAGDPIARIAFQEEIVKRYENGHGSVKEYLIKERYLSDLELEHLKALFMNVLEKGEIPLIEDLLQLEKIRLIQIEDEDLFASDSKLYEAIFTLNHVQLGYFLRKLLQSGCKEPAKIILKNLFNTYIKENELKKLFYMTREGLLTYLSKTDLKPLVIKVLETGNAEVVQSIIDSEFFSQLTPSDLKALLLEEGAFLHEYPLLHQILVHDLHLLLSPDERSCIYIRKVRKGANECLKIEVELVAPRKTYNLFFYEKTYLPTKDHARVYKYYPHCSIDDDQNLLKAVYRSNYANYLFTPLVKPRHLITVFHLNIHDYILNVLGPKDIMIYFVGSGTHYTVKEVRYVNIKTGQQCRFEPDHLEIKFLRKDEKARFHIFPKRTMERGLISDPENYKKITDF